MSSRFPLPLARWRSGEWLDRRRVLAYSAILLAVEIAGFLFLIAGTHGWIVPLTRATTTDFVSFYAAGALADAGTPQLAYDQAAHLAAEERATSPGIEYEYFYYPPVFLMLCALLARLPYLPAFLLFEAASLAAFLLVARRIVGDRSWTALLPLLAFPALFWTLGLGQNAFLTAALFGAATLLVDRRPVAAGLLFGALCYKPHFGLLVPVALAAARNWRAFAAAAASAIALTGLSAVLFGVETWRAFLAAGAASHAVYESGRVDLAGFVSPFGGILLLGGTPALAWAAQLVAALAAAALVGIVWRRGLSLPVRAAALAAATLVAVPVALLYDMMLGAVAAAWLVRAGRESGFLPWEKLVLAVLLPIPMVARNLGDAWHVPVAPLATLCLLAVIARRAACEMLAQRPGRRTAEAAAAQFGA